MKQRLEDAENFYGSIRRVRHEMKNHMTNIKGLVASEKYDEVESYIEKLDETIQTMDYKFNTGNAVTDVIINDKYQKAENAGISFQVKFNLGETDTISAFDIGIILNNLLDNAIEACEKLEQEQRYINLTLKKKNHFLEYKGYFNEKMNSLYTHPSQRNRNDIIDITDAAYKECRLIRNMRRKFRRFSEE